jgi:hypothetical protein
MVINITTTTTIPKIDRIGRFAKIIEKEFGEKILMTVMQGSDTYDSYKTPKKSSWWRSAIAL